MPGKYDYLFSLCSNLVHHSEYFAQLRRTSFEDFHRELVAVALQQERMLALSGQPSFSVLPLNGLFSFSLTSMPMLFIHFLSSSVRSLPCATGSSSSRFSITNKSLLSSLPSATKS